jgi:chromosome segregation ATPase
LKEKETRDFLHQKIANLQSRLQKEVDRLQATNAQEVEDNLIEARRKRDKAKRRLAKMESESAQLEQGVAKRVQKFKVFRKTVSKTSSYMFNDELRKRGMSGKLKFKHKSGEEELDFKVKAHANQATQDSQAQASTDMKSLSGGERSHTTLSLLVSLWQHSGCPFTVLDEFDVFMDAGNRLMALNTLKNAGLETYPNKQFIFITPMDISAVAAHPNIKKHQLQPPIRGKVTGQARQGVLNFAE